MLYTFLGAVFGGFLTYIFLKCINADFRDHRYAPSPGTMGVILGVFAGAGVGFGYGANSLMIGTHLYNKLFN